ncbi:superoxide dismutase [Mn], mitochondrial-like [Hydra vulgaris]|uniref:Superoxide dismutase n=1 Tax=Hydra vulgaris TaxID=6087 RepID=D9I7Q2_HYDVU|nr:superoxide dismutase [Mn], mitochondrial-like [Hydra vulgaris]ADI56237.1 manganese superoxide dismutase [Hydra vulgaris]
MFSFGIHRLSVFRKISRIAFANKHTLPELGYEYNALEPTISSQIMEIHHRKHHQAYVNNLNTAEEQLAEAQHKGDTSKIISLAPALKFNGGGHINHSIFWTNLSPNGGGKPTGELLEAILKDFGSFEAMKTRLSSPAVAVQGSGWGWLGYDSVTKRLAITALPNQDPLQATTGLIPLLGIDVWEHAYYLQYKNVRLDYVNAIFNIIDWKNVSARFVAAK